MNKKESKIQNIYGLSPMQEGMLFHSLYEENSNAYFEQSDIYLKGEINEKLFEKAFTQLIARHDILRTIFLYKKVQKPRQVVMKERDSGIHYEDLTQEKNSSAIVTDYLSKDQQKGFDLSKDLLIRLALFKVSDTNYRVIWSFHHILMDGWCMGIIISEFFHIYQSLVAGIEPQLPQVIPYSNYLNWLTKKDQNEAKQYWGKYLSPLEELTSLPKRSKQKTSEGYRKQVVTRHISTKIYSRLEAICKETGVTINNAFQTLWAILLQEYNNSNQSVFGAVVSGRPAEIPNVDSILGLFINTIPVLVQKEKNLSLKNLISAVQKSNFESAGYDYFPLAEIQKLSPIGRGVFDHILVFENFQTSEDLTSSDSKDMGFSIESMENHEQTNYDLNLIINPEDNALEINFEFNANTYGKNIITEAADKLNSLIHQFAENPDIMVDELTITSEEEKELLIHQYNKTDQTFENNHLILTQFEEICSQNPGKTSLLFEEKEISYKELNETSSKVAQLLSEEHKISKGDVVAIKLGRSEKLIASILGILKTGAAYLPIDPTAPEARIQYVLENSQAKLLLTDTPVEIKTNQIILSDLWNDLKKADGNFNAPSIQPEETAYVIYTSGSTGNPKGVELSHGNLRHYINWTNSYYFEGIEGNFPLYTSIAFDLTITSIFSTLSRGATLQISEQNLEMEEILTNIFQSEVVDIVKITPAHISLLEHLNISSTQIKAAIVGGDQLTQAQIQVLRTLNPEIRIFNEYGPTEATVGCIVKEIPFEEIEEVTIGKPIANMQAYVLKENLQPSGIGIKGELYLSGDGVAKGYINNPDLTGERFIQNPFGGKSKLYKTGDLAYWNQNGELIFIGRNDNQVKIRGYRVELGEIEEALLKLDEVNEAIVILKDQVLVAYFTASGQKDIAKLKEQLGTNLPEYMVPQRLIQLEQMPLTTNGKIDKLKLPDYKATSPESTFEAPSGEVEQKLATIWAEVLGLEKVGIHDDFFMLGGDSIKAIQVSSRLQKFDLKIELKTLFNYKTIARCAPHVKSLGKKIFQGEVTGPFLPTAIQQQFFDAGYSKPDHYNQSMMLFSKELLQTGRLQLVFTELLKHHDVLRLSVKHDDTSPLLAIKPLAELSFEVEEYDLSDQPDPQKEIERKAAEVQAGLNIADGKIFRAVHFITAEGSHLLIVVHHLAIDGVSWRILLEDLKDAYQQAFQGQKIQLPPKTNSFKDWAEHIRRHLDSYQLKKEERYWQTVVEQEVTAIADKTTETTTSTDFDSLSIKLSTEETEDLLTKANKAFYTEINDLLLTALGQALASWKPEGKKLYSIALEGHGREEIFEDLDISRTVGWFTSVFPVVLDMNSAQNLNEQIIFIKEMLRKIPERGVGFGILKYLKRTGLKDKSQLSFNYLGQFDEDISKSNNGFGISPFNSGPDSANENSWSYPLEINALIHENQLSVDFNFLKEVFAKEEVQSFASTFETNLKELISFCCSQKEQIKSESDYGDLALSTNDFELIRFHVDQLDKEIEKVYPLTPMQEGMLFYALMEEGSQSSTYYEQSYFRIKGSLDIDLFQQAFNQIIQRHEVLRTIFISDMIEHPRQVVLTGQKANINLVDFSNKSEEDIISFKEQDRKKPFQLDRDVLMRINILKISDQEYGILWGFHHILMDGWCLGIIMQDFFQIYSALRNGKQPELQEPTPYSNFIEWLQKQDEQKARKYWEAYLKDIETATLLPEIPKVDQKPGILPAEEVLTIGLDLNQKLIDFAHKNGLTINTVFQTLWGILLQKYNSSEGAIFGSVVSGRPSEIENVEEIVGLFINTIPVKVHKEETASFTQLAKEVQQASIDSSEYDFYPLVEVQNLSSLKQNQINHILVFENYPIEEEIKNSASKDDGLGFEIEASEVFEQTNYDLNVNIIPGDTFSINLVYNSHVYDSKTIKRINHHLQKVIETCLTNPEILIRDISLLTENEKQEIHSTIEQQKTNLVKQSTKSPSSNVAPENEIQSQLQKIWQEILGIDDVGINDNFFELGGHSIKAMQVASRIKSELRVPVKLNDLFTYPTIAELAQAISSKTETEKAPLSKAPEAEYYDLSYAQRRLWMIYQIEGGSTNYNMPKALSLEGNLNVEALQKAFQKIIERHESLRTIFVEVDGAPKQKILPAEKAIFEMEIEDVSTSPDPMQAAEQLGSKCAEHIFKLDQFPLIKASLIKVADQKHLFWFNMHHIISDGWSMGVLVNEIFNLYDSFSKGTEPTLKPLQIQYKDFAVWQQQYLSEEVMEHHKLFWHQQLKSYPVLNLPLDFSRPEIQSFEGDHVFYEFSPELSKNMEAFCLTNQITMFVGLTGFISILLSKYGNQEDIILGTPIAGREESELEQIIGFFVNTLVLRNKLDSNKSVVENFQKIKQNTIQTFNHQDYPFDNLVNELVKRRAMDRNPIFDVMVTLENENEILLDNSIELSDINIEGFDPGGKTSKFDLSFEFGITDGILSVNVDYCTKLFQQSTIELLLERLEALMEVACSDPSLILKDIELTSKSESSLEDDGFGDLEDGFNF